MSLLSHTSSVPRGRGPASPRGASGTQASPLACPRQGRVEGALGTARRCGRRSHAAQSPGCPGGSAPGSEHVCGVCMQLKLQLERTEAIPEDEQTQRLKLTAEFEEVRLPRAVGASLGQGGGSRALSRVPPQGVSLRHRHPPPGHMGPAGHMGPDPLPRSVQAQLESSRLQGELEKLRCSSALGSSEAEEATRLKVQGSLLSPLEAPRVAYSLIRRLARSGGSLSLQCDDLNRVELKLSSSITLATGQVLSSQCPTLKHSPVTHRLRPHTLGPTRAARWPSCCASREG